MKSRGGGRLSAGAATYAPRARGPCRANVTRALGELEAAGMLRLGRRTIEINRN